MPGGMGGSLRRGTKLALTLIVTLVLGLTLTGSSRLALAFTGEATPAAPVAMARIHDRDVFPVKVPRLGHSAAERAQHASEVLTHAVDDAGSAEIRVDQGGDVAVLYLGDTPVIQLGPEDAAADGDASVAVHAAVVAAHATDALHAERRRSAIARTVFSFSLLVFSALIVFLSIGKLGGLVSRARAWVASRPSTIPTVQIAGIDVVRPTALRGVALGAIDASRWGLRIGLVYVWLLFALSLFDGTRAYSERLTGYVLAPISGFIGRLTATMPVLFLGLIAGVGLLLLLRVIALFFDGVTRGEPALSWLPGDLAAPTSVLVRAGLVVVAISGATPLLTGGDEGPLSRAGVIATGAVALALTPVMANIAVGVTVLYGRHFKVGDFVELGGRAGVVRALQLLSVTLEDWQGCTVRVPHLSSLVHPTRVLGSEPPVAVRLTVPSTVAVDQVTTLLRQAAERVGVRARVGLASMDGATIVYELTAQSSSPTARSELLAAAVRALHAAGILHGPATPSPATTGATPP
jgi:small-conductance mechanosensitive channel